MKTQKKGIVRRIFKILFFLIVFLIITTSIVGFAGFLAISKNFPDMKVQNIDDLLQETSFIYDDSGNMTEKIQSNVYRTIVPIENIPMNLQKAFIAIEDERFYEHGGIDVKRLFGALWHDIKVGSMEQGASTITMQLSKNVFTSADKKFTRKLTDMVYAMELEKKLNKTQILYAYLNTVFLGSNVNGVQAAAKSYFNKNIDQINLAESAIIAGITKYPTRYIPYKLKSVTAQDDLSSIQIKMYPPPNDAKHTPSEGELAIYSKLRSIGKIDQYEYILLKNGSLILTKAELNPDAVGRAKVILKKMLELNFINNEQYNEALNTKVVISFPARNNSGISTYFNDKVKKEAIRLLIEQGRTEEQANELLKFGGLKIYTTLNTKMQKILENEFADGSNFPNSFNDDDGVIQPQAAMVVIEQSTGYVKALIGGRGQAGSYIYDRADNPRQPGSAIKPLAVYLLALKDGQTPNTLIDDTPRKDPKFPGGYWPKNIFDIYYGRSTMRKMIAVSSNVAAVKTMETLGDTKEKAVNRSLDYLEQMGFSYLVRSTQDPASNDEHLSLALGGITKGVTPLEIASAYSGIANLGKQIKPTFIKQIQNSDGEIIYQHKPKVFEMIDPPNAYRMTDMLTGVVKNGSAKDAILSNMPSAGKTGTTTDRKDVYFVGYTPYYTASIWIGADTPTPLDYTSAIPASIWKKVMNNINSNFKLTNKAFDIPANMNEPKQQPAIEEQEVVEELPPEPPKEEETVDPSQQQQLDDLLFEEKNQNNNNNEQNQNNGQNTEQPIQNPPTNNETPQLELPPDPNPPQPEPTPEPDPIPEILEPIPQQPPENEYEDTQNEQSNESETVVF